MDKTEPVSVDNAFGALECPRCKKCKKGDFSNSATEFHCAECSTSCDQLSREYLTKCNGKENNKCGRCTNRHYNPVPYLSSFPCEPCSESTLDKVECQDFKPTSALHEKLTSIVITSMSPVSDEHQTMKRTDHPLKMTEIILILVATGLVIVVMVAICYLVKCLIKTHRSDEPATGEFGSSSSTSSAQKLLQQKDDPQPEDIEVDADPETDKIPDLGSLGIPDVTLNCSDCWIRTVSTRIDKDPDALFKALRIQNHIIFLESPQRTKGISEYVLAVLNRWVGVEGRNARLYVLYEALKETRFSGLCKAIVENGKKDDESLI